MIGLGLIAVPLPDGTYELHKTSPWALAIAMQVGRMHGWPAVDAMILKSAEEQAWKPDAVVDAAELDRIRHADGPGAAHHELACDCFYLVGERPA